MELLAHYADHMGPMGWIFIGAGACNLNNAEWLVGSLFVLMPIFAVVKAHEEECLDP